jgi:hypothetical protein
MNLFKYSACIIVLFAFFAACTNDKNELPEPADGCIVDSVTITWDNTVHSIISNSCATAGCHVPDSAGGNGFDFTTYALVKAKIDNGVFQHRVFIVRDMPPPETTVLSPCDLKKLKTWVDNGAPE